MKIPIPPNRPSLSMSEVELSVNEWAGSMRKYCAANADMAVASSAGPSPPNQPAAITAGK
jgi:hypothetical protein